MKKSITVLLFTLVLLGIGSCDKTKDKLDEFTQFDMTLPSANVKVPASTFTANVSQALDIETPEVETKSADEISKNGSAPDLVSEIKITKLSLSSSENMDYLKSVTVFIKSGGSETRVAKKDNIPPGISSLDLDLDDVDVKEYITKEKVSFKIRVTLDGSKLPAMEQTLSINGKVHVKASLKK